MKRMLFVLVFISFASVASVALCETAPVEIPAALMELTDEEWADLEKEMGMTKDEILNDSDLMNDLSGPDTEIEASDGLAQRILLILSEAAETFAAGNNGDFPKSIEDLTEGEDPFLERKYCGEELAGYKFDCEFFKKGYKFVATPQEVGVSGTEVYSIVTGGVETPDFYLNDDEEEEEDEGEDEDEAEIVE